MLQLLFELHITVYLILMAISHLNEYFDIT